MKIYIFSYAIFYLTPHPREVVINIANDRDAHHPNSVIMREEEGVILVQPNKELYENLKVVMNPQARMHDTEFCCENISHLHDKMIL